MGATTTSTSTTATITTDAAAAATTTATTTSTTHELSTRVRIVLAIKICHIFVSVIDFFFCVEGLIPFYTVEVVCWMLPKNWRKRLKGLGLFLFLFYLLSLW